MRSAGITAATRRVRLRTRLKYSRNSLRLDTTLENQVRREPVTEALERDALARFEAREDLVGRVGQQVGLHADWLALHLTEHHVAQCGGGLLNTGHDAGHEDGLPVIPAVGRLAVGLVVLPENVGRELDLRRGLRDPQILIGQRLRAAGGDERKRDHRSWDLHRARIVAHQLARTWRTPRTCRALFRPKRPRGIAGAPT